MSGLKRDKYGRSSEGLDQLGLCLEDEETDIAATDDAEAGLPDAEPDKQKPVRRALPEDLPRNDVKLLPDAPCAGCGNDLSIAGNVKTLGEDVLEGDYAGFCV